MSTASISRSPFEAAPPARRDPTKARRTDEAFTLPLPEKPGERTPANRPRLDEGRGASRSAAAAVDRAGSRETVQAGTPAHGAEKTDNDAKAAGETQPGEAKAEAGQPAGVESVTSEKPATGEEAIPVLPQPAPAVASPEERKAALEAALAGASAVLSDGVITVGEAAGQPEGAKPGSEPSEISAQLLALAAGALQPGEPAKPVEAAAEDAATASANGETVTMIALPANAVTALVAPAPSARADGEASSGGEAAIGALKAGPRPAMTGVVVPGEVAKTEAGTAGEAGSAPTNATAEGKAPERPTGAAQAPAADGGQVEAPQQAAPPIVQAPPAAAPQVPARPEPPLAPLDAAAQANAQAQAEANARAPVETTRPTPLHVVPVEIGARALAGNKRFDIRLDPAELGRVDVRLEISEDGSVSAKLTVDRVETLHLLQRDTRTLERAFEQAGLKPSEGGVEMSLRDSSDQSSRQHRPDDEGARTRRAWVETAEESALAAEAAPLRRAGRLGGVDLSI